MRADFAPEIWAGLGLGKQPAIFTQSELWVTLGVVVVNGAVVLIPNNRRAFFTSLGLAAGGLALAVFSSWLDFVWITLAAALALAGVISMLGWLRNKARNTLGKPHPGLRLRG